MADFNFLFQGIKTVDDLWKAGICIAGAGMFFFMLGTIALVLRKSGASGAPHFTLIVLSLVAIFAGAWTLYYTESPDVPPGTSMRDFTEMKRAATTWDEAAEKGYTFRLDSEKKDPKVLRKSNYNYTVSDESRTVYLSKKTSTGVRWNYALLVVPPAVVVALLIKS